MWVAEDVAKERGFVFNYLCSLCRDRDLADDLTQDTLIKGIVSLPGFRGDSSIRSWLYTIARNTWVNYLRGKKETVCIDDISIVSNAPDVMDNILLDEVKDIVLMAVDKVSIKHREVFLAFLFEGVSYKGIGSRFRLSIGSVGNCVARVRDYIIKYVRKVYEIESPRFSYSNKDRKRDGVFT